MIEIIGRKNIDESNLPERELPKNVRQIGETRERRKIYIEDYVVTYLGKLAKPNQAYARGAILFGNLYQTQEGPAVFISGAMEAQNLELDMDETIFNDEIWRELLRKGEKYFKGQKVMGWFLSRMGFSVEMNQKIVNTHLQNFPGNHTVLYMIDSLEKEDAVYMCENQQMLRQKGYYIYYEKNGAMQDYMLLGKSVRKEREEMEKKEEKPESVFRDKKILEQYRKKAYYKRKSHKINYGNILSKAASLLLIIVMCGYIYVRTVDKSWSDGAVMNRIVETMGVMRNSFVTDEKVVEEVFNGGETDEAVEVNKTKKETSFGEEGEKSEQATVTTEAAFAQSKPLYYIVQKGDTLASISRKMYLTDKYMKQIAWANDLTNANQIYEGQKLLIPAME